jgi:hypothetical protein
MLYIIFSAIANLTQAFCCYSIDSAFWTFHFVNFDE